MDNGQCCSISTMDNPCRVYQGAKKSDGGISPGRPEVTANCYDALWRNTSTTFEVITSMYSRLAQYRRG
jgi:hypothetical protein